MATLYTRGRSIYLSWSEGGEHYRRSLGPISPQEAERIRSAKAAELEHGVRILPRLPTLGAFMERYGQWYADTHPATAKRLGYEVQWWIARFGGRPIDQIRPIEIEMAAAERLKTRAPETVGKELRRFKAALKRGVKWREIDANPFEDVTAPRGARSVAVKFYTVADVARLARTPRGPLWRVLACTGLRRGETVQVVQSRDVVADGRTTVLRVESDPGGKGRTKSGKWREIPLNAAAEASLIELPDRIADCHPDTLGDWFRADARSVGLPGGVHRLRHTFCAHLAMAGVPLRRIQLLAGHADYKTTEMYAHLAPQGADDAVAKLRF